MDILKSLTNCKVLSTVSQSEDEAEWLKNRSRGIGGSDIGAICGVSAYSSPRMVYLRKTGQYDDRLNVNDAAKERMRWGNLLEPIVADEFAKRTGRRIAVSPATLVHKDYPWALANIDRFIVDDEGKPYGILECKTAGEFMNDDWDEGTIPMSYIYQLNWYLWICGLEYGAFACLVGGNKFYFYEVFRNDELLQYTMVPAADQFWNENVLKLVEPPLIGSDADKEYVNEQNAGVVKNSEMVLKEDTYNDLAQTIIDCKAKIKELEAIQTEAENRIKDALKTTEIGYTTDHTIKWSPRSQTRVDTDTLKANFPEIYEKCKKIISFRVLSIK